MFGFGFGFGFNLHWPRKRDNQFEFAHQIESFRRIGLGRSQSPRFVCVCVCANSATRSARAETGNTSSLDSGRVVSFWPVGGCAHERQNALSCACTTRTLARSSKRVARANEHASVRASAHISGQRVAQLTRFQSTMSLEFGALSAQTQWQIDARCWEHFGPAWLVAAARAQIRLGPNRPSWRRFERPEVAACVALWPISV